MPPDLIAVDYKYNTAFIYNNVKFYVKIKYFFIKLIKLHLIYNKK